MPARTQDPVEFCGISVSGLTAEELVSRISEAIESGTCNNIIANHNLHSLYLFHTLSSMPEFYRRALLTHVDGMSLILLANAMGIPMKRSQRTGYLDWIDELLKNAAKRGWRVYFLGGKEQMASQVPGYFSNRIPGLQIRSHHGYDSFSQETTVYAEIEEFQPHIVMVGMGMPLQEQWILQALNKVRVNVFLPCGATMDYFIGTQPPAPRWLDQIGLEWLYRLVTNPRRLYPRYLIEPLQLTALLLKKLVRKEMSPR